MNKIILKGLIAGGTLLLVSYITLFLLVKFMPGLAEQYYDPMFSLKETKPGCFLSIHSSSVLHWPGFGPGLKVCLKVIFGSEVLKSVWSML